MSLFEDGRVTHIPAVAKEVYDVTGAGDTVLAALALAMASGAPCERRPSSPTMPPVLWWDEPGRLPSAVRSWWTHLKTGYRV